jgi:hypothetical protein
MIARASTAAEFGSLARYLATGREGSCPTRVAWTESRNLPSDDPLLGADLMQATASQNLRTQEPAYHLALSFAPEDNPTPQHLRQVADRALAELGLADHQAILVAHDDRAHAHVHIVVNRVHPDTLAVWDRWRDQTTLQRVLADLERALGVRELSAHDRAVDRVSPGSGPADAARHRDRAAERAFAEQLRTLLPEVRASRTWQELRERLAAHDLQLERRAKGLVITDGSMTIRASALAADVSFARLEARLGPVDDHDRTAPRSPEPTRTAFELTRDRDAAGRRLHSLDWLTERTTAADRDLKSPLADVYADPTAAARAFKRAAAIHGTDHAARTLAQTPETFGPLRTNERRYLFGLLRFRTHRPARVAATAIAPLAREAVVAAHEQRRALDLQPDASADVVTAALDRARMSALDTIERASVSLAQLARDLASPSEPARDRLRDGPGLLRNATSDLSRNR